MKKLVNKRLSLILATLMMISLVIVGCSSDSDEADSKNKTDEISTNSKESIKFENDDYIVSIDWLKENLNKKELLILDARGEEDYKKGHIPGAISVTWQQFSKIDGKPGETEWGTVLDAKELSEKLSAIGVTKDKDIVVYADTQKGWGDDGRIVWMLRMAGIDNSKILDGGWNYWNASKNEVSKETETPARSSFELSAIQNIEKMNIRTEEIVDKLKDLVIIDTREKEEYEGATKFGEARGGHLPGAINITFSEFLNKDGTLKKPEEIKEILDKNGIEKDDEIVTYCTAGIRSAHMQIVLTMIGYDNVRNYDQSFYSWAGDNNLEIEK
ncbi:thiosulfate sulfurtransferase, rhodanese-like protein RhdA [Gottschalkia acidurici 9a]|uniref:thiosulfate sulfurtransferase n=1 Tax=Gottschalkia acidurici (strain ATCC 7906 / DSM 604 / BCRC 14475 / CIP 104303 / KCTC 5404 / NCIMB 10678 / 9a) TaxID=1128398 RepID=K0B4Z5_GOTA9|nr:sulfurtransferase [Gottschalkia acidurici]AFS79636.1 thiosulfate sulfurtransferase, rhodanese-like protein RhdA [Gottschalkia acidurici 9a]